MAIADSFAYACNFIDYADTAPTSSSSSPSSSSSSSSPTSSSSSSSYRWYNCEPNATIYPGDMLTITAGGTVAPARPGDYFLGCATAGTYSNTDNAMYFLNEGAVRIFPTSTLVTSEGYYNNYRAYTYPPPPPIPPIPNIEVRVDREELMCQYRIQTRDSDGQVMQRLVSDHALYDRCRSSRSVQDQLEYFTRNQIREHQQACINRGQEEAQRAAIDRIMLETNPQDIRADQMEGTVYRELSGRLDAARQQQAMEAYNKLNRLMTNESERLGIREVQRGEYRGDYQMGVDHQDNNYAEQMMRAQQRPVDPDMDAYRILQRKRENAEMKAVELLGKIIGNSELEVYKRTGNLYVKGKRADYIIPREGFIKQIKDDKVIDLCVHLNNKESMPKTDNVIAMKASLECREDEVLEMANNHGEVRRDDFVVPEAACM